MPEDPPTAPSALPAVPYLAMELVGGPLCGMGLSLLPPAPQTLPIFDHQIGRWAAYHHEAPNAKTYIHETLLKP